MESNVSDEISAALYAITKLCQLSSTFTDAYIDRLIDIIAPSTPTDHHDNINTRSTLRSILLGISEKRRVLRMLRQVRHSYSSSMKALCACKTVLRVYSSESLTCEALETMAHLYANYGFHLPIERLDSDKMAVDEPNVQYKLSGTEIVAQLTRIACQEPRERVKLSALLGIRKLIPSAVSTGVERAKEEQESESNSWISVCQFAFQT